MKQVCWAVVALILHGSCCLVAAETKSARPNILVILADDVGFSDLGCYGGEIRTPNLDRLAAGGVRFTQAYNSSRCCPSRASLLTGLYPHQAGIGRFVGGGDGLPGYQGKLSKNAVTLAEVLGKSGYSTYACGKWHVNDPGPVARGFEEFYGFIHGYAVNSWEPKMMTRRPAGRPERVYSEGRYFATDAITDHALDFLEISRTKHKPWLMYVAYQAAHFPLHAPAKLTASYVDIYKRGWDVLRAERLARLKKLGIMPEGLDLPLRSPIDRPDIAKRIGSLTADGVNPAWDSLDEKRRADLAQRMSVYAAMIEGMDSGVGRLVESLEAHDELDNTLILFLSDNGACAEWEPFGFDLDASRFPKPTPGTGIDGGTQGSPNILHEGDALAAMGGPETLMSYGCCWANLSNTPFSLYKHYAHEGGIHAPFIAHWPAKIVQPGGFRNHVVHLMDIMATCVELADAKYPTEFGGNEITPMAGRSFVPALLNKPAEPRMLIFEHEHNAAIRDGDWKLVGKDILGRDGVKPAGRWELYDLSHDPAEQHDLASSKPEMVKELKEKFLKEAHRTFVLPAP